MKTPADLSPFKLIRKIDDLTKKVEASNLKTDQLLETQADQYIKLSTQLTNSSMLHNSDGSVIKKLFNGLKIFLDISDLSVAAHIALDGIWEPDITNAWVSLIRPEYTVLDIGANFGYFGLLAAHLTDKKKSRVVLFEANAEIVPYIRKTFSLNWYNEQSTIENLAVSNKSGKVKLNVLKNYTGSSSLQSLKELGDYTGDKMDLALKKTVEVRSTSIDEYCKISSISEVNLIKMDIEGHEEQAYEGMREIVKKSPEITMFIEFTKESYGNAKKFYNTMLQDFGNVFLIEDGGKLTRPKDNSYEAVVGECEDWVMPVFTKIKNLDGTVAV